MRNPISVTFSQYLYNKFYTVIYYLLLLVDKKKKIVLVVYSNKNSVIICNLGFVVNVAVGPENWNLSPPHIKGPKLRPRSPIVRDTQ